MYRLSEKQEEFCKLVGFYGVEPWQAVKEVGYAGHCRAQYMNIACRLLRDIHISSRIDEVREEMFDLDKVRRSIILEHQMTRIFDVTKVMYPITSYLDDGTEYTRVVVKPMEEWPYEARRLCVGFDKFNRPIFKNKENATKELTRIFGLYKDNAVKEEEDTDGVLAGSGLTPTNTVSGMPDNYEEEEFDGEALDAEIGVDSEAAMSEDETVDEDDGSIEYMYEAGE